MADWGTTSRSTGSSCRMTTFTYWPGRSTPSGFGKSRRTGTEPVVASIVSPMKSNSPGCS
jgi:hypothetical protein